MTAPPAKPEASLPRSINDSDDFQHHIWRDNTAVLKDIRYHDLARPATHGHRRLAKLRADFTVAMPRQVDLIIGKRLSEFVEAETTSNGSLATISLVRVTITAGRRFFVVPSELGNSAQTIRPCSRLGTPNPPKAS